MRSAGALSLQNGVWILPRSQKNEELVQNTASFIQGQSGTALVLTAKTIGLDAENKIIQMFQNNIDEEYTEFQGRCKDFLTEIEKETSQSHFTFAELDEIEEDMHKMTSWLRKIQTREYFESSQASQARTALEKCQQELTQFTKSVYANEGLEAEDTDITSQSELEDGDR